MTPETERRCQDLQDARREQCRQCKVRVKGRYLEKHCRQHFTRFYCQCGWQSVSKDCTMRHQRKLDYIEGHGRSCYKVDATSFERLAKDMGWAASIEFLPCVPHLKVEDRDRAAPASVADHYRPARRDSPTNLQQRLGRIPKRQRRSPTPPEHPREVAPPAPRVQAVDVGADSIDNLRQQISRTEVHLYHLRRRLRQLEQEEEDRIFRRRHSSSRH